MTELKKYLESQGCRVWRDMKGPIESVDGRVRICYTTRKENLYNYKNCNVSIFRVFDDMVRFSYWS